MKKIAIDVMGSDHGVSELVKGVKRFIKEEKNVECILFGDQEQISNALNGHKRNISIVHTTQVIGMTDGALSIRRKKDSSLVKAMNFAENGKVDAVISCGSSAAVVSAAFFGVKTIPGVKRPGFMPIAPNPSGGHFVMCDVGASLENDAKDLENFGVMGSVFCKNVLKINNPRTAIINVGAESGKGPVVSNEAFKLLEANKKINFKGFIEPRYLFSNKADVVVSDGYTGNIALKTIEGTASTFSREIKKNLLGGWVKKSLMLISPHVLIGLKKLSKTFDYKRAGGAIVMGVNKVVVKSHGSSDAREFYYAIKLAHKTIDNNFVETIKKEVQ